MPSPQSVNEFLDLTRKSQLVDDERLTAHVEKLRAASSMPKEPVRLAECLVRDGLLTRFQAEQLLQGKWKRFTIGKYKVLEKLGSGGMGSVYLCEHMLMRRRVAVKVLPAGKAEDPASLERFYREARAVAALDHPNIVRAYDIDQDVKLHFIVMEHVDGASFQDIVKKAGPFEPIRAAHYMRQAALGLQHAHEVAGVVHRDIKPGNILVDRSGIVKILDMGLARFFYDEEDILTRKYDENVLGTADYLAPEQALDSHLVDIRADIYSLGATFYFCLTGQPPFAEGTVAQKLIWHQTRQPRAIRTIRPEIPEGIAAVLDRMMSKKPDERYQQPSEVGDALLPWTQTPIDPPPDSEMPTLSIAAMGVPSVSENPPARTNAEKSPTPRRSWKISSEGQSSTAPTSDPPVASNAPTTPTPAPASPAPVSPPPRPIPQGQPATQPAIELPSLEESDSKPESKTRPASRNGNHVPRPRREESAEHAVTTESPPSDRSWADSLDDTQPSNAVGDTVPSAKRNKPTFVTQIPKKWLWIGGVGGGVLLLLGGILIWSLSGSDTPSGKGNTDPEVDTLYVDVSGADRAYRSLAEAYSRASDGDRIVLRSDIRENVAFSTRSVILEAAPGKTIVWSAPRHFKNSTRRTMLLLLQNVENCRIRGITFNGEGTAQHAIQLYGKCPGLTLENLDLKNYLTSGILATNCEGTEEKPIVFSNIRFSPSNNSAKGIEFLNADTVVGVKNRFYRLTNLTFQGIGGSKHEEFREFKENIPNNFFLPPKPRPKPKPKPPAKKKN